MQLLYKLELLWKESPKVKQSDFQRKWWLNDEIGTILEGDSTQIFKLGFPATGKEQGKEQGKEIYVLSYLFYWSCDWSQTMVSYIWFQNQPYYASKLDKKVFDFAKTINGQFKLSTKGACYLCLRGSQRSLEEWTFVAPDKHRPGEGLPSCFNQKLCLSL